MLRKEITIFIFGNYTPNSVRFSIPLGLVRVIVVFLCLVVMVVLFALGMAVSGAYRFSRLVYLAHRNRQLEAEFKKVAMLKERLEFLENERQKMAKMLGVDFTPEPVNWKAGCSDSFALPEWVKNQPWGSHPIPVLVPVSDYYISRLPTPEHLAIDLAAPKNSPIRAAADGIVAMRGNDKEFGYYIILRHAQGYETYYAHLASILLKQGDTVKVGDIIGRVGTTGRASAPHLHLEIRKDGNPIDPVTMLKF